MCFPLTCVAPLAVSVALFCNTEPNNLGPDRGGALDIKLAFQKERRRDVKLDSVSVERDVFTEHPGTAPLK